MLVLAVWSLALLVLFIWTEPRFPDGLLITALNGDVGLGPVWLQNVVCLFYVVTTSVVLVYSRPKGFSCSLCRLDYDSFAQFTIYSSFGGL